MSKAIVKAGERREEQLGDNLLDEMRRVQRKAWELVAKTESEGDHRGAIVALREVRECLESLGEMLARVQSPGGSPNLGQALEAAKRRVENMSEAELGRRLEELLTQKNVLQGSVHSPAILDVAQDGRQNQKESKRRTEQSEVAKLPTNVTGTLLMNP